MNILKEMLKKPLSQKQLIMLSIAMAGAAVILAVITGGG